MCITNVIQVDAIQVDAIQTNVIQVNLIQVSRSLQSNTRGWTIVQNFSVTCTFQGCKGGGAD